MSQTETAGCLRDRVTMPCGATADHTLAELVGACEQIPTHLLKSVTFDQGSEWAHWQTLAAMCNIKAWFRDTHSPWQRAQIENQNRAWRWCFPRGTKLDYQTPANLYATLTVQWPLELVAP